MRKKLNLFLLVAVIVVAAGILSLASEDATDPSLGDVVALMNQVRHDSFPKLQDARIDLRYLSSDYIFLEAQFTPGSFFKRQLRYNLLFNPLARGAPNDALRAIMAHELAHVDFYESQSRMGLLALVQILSARYNARFERAADLETIRLGYGPGLRSFRLWLYQQIPSSRMEEKKRDYFSPEEIDAILAAMRADPGVMKTFSRCVPLDLAGINREASHPDAVCQD
jgi:hypothetical protein